MKVVSLNDHTCEAEEVEPGEFEGPIKPGWKVVAAREPGEEPKP